MSGEHTICECKSCGNLYIATSEHRSCPVCNVADKVVHNLAVLDEHAAQIRRLRERIEKLEKSQLVLLTRVDALDKTHYGLWEKLDRRIEKLESPRAKAQRAHEDWDEKVNQDAAHDRFQCPRCGKSVGRLEMPLHAFQDIGGPGDTGFEFVASCPHCDADRLKEEKEGRS
jgi:rubrerythrin